MRRIAPVLLVAVALLAPAAAHGQAATAAIDVDEIVPALRTDPVYDGEDLLSAAEEDRLNDVVARDAGGPLYLVTLPADTPAGHAEVGAALQERLGAGVYGIVIGDQFRAGETAGSGLDQDAASAIATEAAQAGGDPGEVLERFVSDVGEARANGGSPDSGTSNGAWVLIGVLVVGAGAVVLMRRRARRHEASARVEEVRRLADEDLVALGEDIRALDLDVEMPGVDERAKADYARALEAHTSASEGLRAARTPEDFEPISHTLEEGRYAMESAKARLRGEEPPEHRAPCFFDPRHGPSTRDVEWAPEWGEPRLVPACEADAVRVEAGRAPMAREIELAGRGRTPYWNAPAHYGPYAGGFYGGFGGTGLLTGFLAGSLLTSMWAAPMAYGAGWGGDWDGGDLGGGFGGGDFGGFGGGDFGGGGDF